MPPLTVGFDVRTWSGGELAVGFFRAGMAVSSLELQDRPCAPLCSGSRGIPGLHEGKWHCNYATVLTGWRCGWTTRGEPASQRWRLWLSLHPAMGASVC